MSIVLSEQVAETSPELRMDTRLFKRGVKVGSQATRYTIEIPEAVDDDGLLIVIAGFGGYEDSMKKPRNVRAAKHGRATLTYDPFRKLKNPKDAMAIHVETLEAITNDLHDFSVRRELVSDRRIDVDKQDLDMWSMGLKIGARYAANNPSAINRMVSFAGVDPKAISPETVVMRGPKIITSTALELAGGYYRGDLSLNPFNMMKFGRYVLRPQSFFEAYSGLTESALNDVAIARGEGIPVAYVAAGDDAVVLPNEELRDFFDYHEVMPDIAHLGPVCQTERVAAKMIEVFQSLPSR